MQFPRVHPLLLGVAAAVGALLVTRKVAEDEVWPGPAGDRALDPYSPKEIAAKGARSMTAKPGTLLFRQWGLARWGERPGSPQNIVADKDGEHGEGRAWDLMTTGHDHGQRIVDDMTAPDPVTGEPDALARRSGLMYMIWNRRIWRSYQQGNLPPGSWGPYTGASPHTDHVHFSFGWAGARGDTSLYDEIRSQFPAA